MGFRYFFGALILALVGTVGSQAQTVWNGGGGGNTDWSDTLNWQGGMVPTNSFSGSVQFSNASSYTSTLDSNYQLASLTISGTAGSLTLNNASTQTLSISGAFTDSSASTVSVDIPLVYSTMSLQMNGTSTLTLNGTSNTYGGLTNITSGTLIDGNAGAYSPNSGIVVGPGASLDVNNDETISYLDNYMGNAGSVVIQSGATLTMNGGYTTTFPGVISGMGGIQMNTTGTLILTGSNTYTGPTGIGSGAAIQIGNGGASGSLSSSGVSGAGSLSFDVTGPLVISSTLSGALNVVQQGTGATTLSGTNTYSGPTTVNNGTLQAGSTTAFGGTGNSDVTVASGALLILNGFNNQIGSLAGAGTVALGANTLTVGNIFAAAKVFSGSITGGGVFDMAGYVEDLTNGNSYSGGTTIAAGTLEADNPSGSATGSGGITIQSGGTLQIGNGSADTSGAVNGAASITDNGNIAFFRTSFTFTNPLSGTGGVTQNSTATTTLTGANTYSGTTSVFQGTLQAGSTSAFGGATGLSAVSFPFDGILNLAGFSNSVGSISGGASGGGVTLGSGTLTIANPSSHTSFAGYITGTGSLDFGGGSIILTGANNTYSGGTLITNGSVVADNPSGSATGTGTITLSPGTSLQIGVADTNGSVSAATITDNGTVIFNRTDNITITSAINGTGGVNVQESGGSVTLEGANSYGGPTVVSSGELEDWGATSLSPSSSVQIGSGGSLGINDNETVADLENIAGAGGPVSLASGTTLTIGTGNAALAPFLGIISGPGAITIDTGSNSQGFGGANTYTGVTTMDSGEIFVSSSTVGAPGSITSGPIGTNTLVFAGNGEMSSITNNVTLANAISLGGYNLDNDDATTNLTLTGPISGPGGSITWCTNNVLALINSNTFTGGVDMREGTLLLGSDTGAGVGGTITLDLDTFLDAAGSGVTRNIANPIFVSNAYTTIGTYSDNNLTLSGPISGSGTTIFVQEGPTGSLTLTNDNSGLSTAQFDVDSGTVVAANNNAFGTPSNVISLEGGAALTVNSGVTIANPITTLFSPNTIGGSGTIGSPAITADSTVILSPTAAPGGGPGNLTFTNNLTLASGAAIHFDIYDATGAAGTGYGLITAAGGLNLTASANTITFNLVSTNSTGGAAAAINFNSAIPYSWTFASSSSAITGFNPNQFNLVSSFINGTNGGTFSFTESGNNLDLNFTPVPEPSTWAMIGLGVLGIAAAGFGRRRAARA
jgi:autotransporter-associated beta strand protein